AFDDHVAAAPAIAAIGAAELDEFLAQEADCTGTAVAGAHIDFRLVEKFHVVSLAAAPCRSSSQRDRVNRVSIWRRSSPRARQCFLPEPVVTKPSFACTASDALLKAKAPEPT